MSQSSQPELNEGAASQVAVSVPFGANEVRLSGPQWLMVLLIVGSVVLFLPHLWPHWETVDFVDDYRVPYELSKDYWLYQQWLEHADTPESVYVVGDSVVWGEYVTREGTLSAFLNQQAGDDIPFVNAGVNGLFPLALEGLVAAYGKVMQERRVILHANLLWMTSAEADLSSSKEQRFNHPKLVPQFSPSIPCYRATFDERLGIAIGRRIPFLGFVAHLQNNYFDQKGIYQWTLADDGDYPPSYPQTYRWPWTAIDFRVPGELDPDPDRGPNSQRHQAWATTGEGTQNFSWVPLESSLQWGAFQRLLALLLMRENDVLVVVGPLNRHIMSPENQLVFDQRQREVVQWLQEQDVSVMEPETLPFELYGDASHPLTDGYRRLAESMWQNAGFQSWLSDSNVR